MGLIFAFIIAAVGVLVLLAALFRTGHARRVAFILACWLVVIIGAGWLFGR